MRYFSFLALAAFLSGCAGSSGSILPPAGSSPIRAADETADPGGNGMTGLPGGNGMTGLPGGNGMTGLPGGNGMTGLPGGNGMTGLPGDLLACPTAGLGQAACTIALNTNVPPIAAALTPASLLPGLHPNDLQNAYELPSQNSGGTVAIVDAYDDPLAEVDLAVYRAAYGLPACTSLNGCFRKVNQQGATASYPASNAAWDEEISIDLDMVSAACPHCSILLVEANTASIDDLGAGVDTAARMGAKTISNSYYAGEWSGEASEDVHYNHPGVAITVASGDQGWPSYPGASPYVTSVGGTSLSGAAGAWTQTPWAGTGRGCSAYEARPWWQFFTGCKTKSTVDVAAVADPQTGVSMFDSSAGGWMVAGGTSVGAPIIAAAYALSGNPASPLYSYYHWRDFQGIPSPGYNYPTGLGSPIGIAGL